MEISTAAPVSWQKNVYCWSASASRELSGRSMHNFPTSGAEKENCKISKGREVMEEQRPAYAILSSLEEGWDKSELNRTHINQVKGAGKHYFLSLIGQGFLFCA